MFIESTTSLPSSQEIFVRVRTGEFGENLILLWVNYRDGQLKMTNPHGDTLCDSIGQPISEDELKMILFLLQQRMAECLFAAEASNKEQEKKNEKNFTSPVGNSATN